MIFSGSNVVSFSPQPLNTDGATLNVTPGDISHLASTGVPLIFPGAMGGKSKYKAYNVIFVHYKCHHRNFNLNLFIFV